MYFIHANPKLDKSLPLTPQVIIIFKTSNAHQGQTTPPQDTMISTEAQQVATINNIT